MNDLYAGVERAKDGSHFRMKAADRADIRPLAVDSQMHVYLTEGRCPPRNSLTLHVKNHQLFFLSQPRSLFGRDQNITGTGNARGDVSKPLDQPEMVHDPASRQHGLFNLLQRLQIFSDGPYRPFYLFRFHHAAFSFYPLVISTFRRSLQKCFILPRHRLFPSYVPPKQKQVLYNTFYFWLP